MPFGLVLQWYKPKQSLVRNINGVRGADLSGTVRGSMGLHRDRLHFRHQYQAIKNVHILTMFNEKKHLQRHRR